MNFEAFQHAVVTGAAIRRRQRLQPSGGQGDKIFPPTYPGEENGDPPRHVFERRKIDGGEKVCVLIDSVQSQANRMEEALLRAAEEGRIRLPRLSVDFPGAGLNSIGAISSLEAPHRIFDAILRDSELEGQKFRDSDIGVALRAATAKDATAILQVSPTSLLFGAWNSTGEGGGLGAKFARVIVSEMIGVDVPVYEMVDRRSGVITMATAGRRTGSRIDPLGILKGVEVYKDKSNNWEVSKDKLGKDAKLVRPSETNHGNIAPSVDALGVTCDYALHTLVITLAGLRRLRFGDVDKDTAARVYLAALGLVAALEADRQGHSLRSRCDLVCDGRAPLELIAFDGATTELALSADDAVRLHEQAYDAASRLFGLKSEPIILKPQPKLVELVRRSQEKALRDEGGEEE